MQTRAILFDFDGTLAPNLDLPDMRRQVVALTEQAKVPTEIWQDQYIVEIIDTATDWLEANSSTNARRYHQQAHQLITDFEIAAAKETDPFPGVRTLLQQLQKQGLALGVVTRNCRAAVLAVFPDLLEHVHTLWARDDTQFLKPDLRHLSGCLAQLDTSATDAVMVGDGALDMHAGRALHMHCIGVLTGSSDTQKLIKAGAHQVVEHCLDMQLP